MLNQREIAKFLDQCEGDNIAIEEVLSGYVIWKYMRGSSSAMVLTKLRYLSIFLRVTGRGHIVESGRDAFTAIAMEVSLGGGRIGDLPSITAPGKAVVNKIRRHISHSSNFATEAIYGGPLPVSNLLTELQRSPSNPTEAGRTAWAERYFLRRVTVATGIPTIIASDSPEGNSRHPAAEVSTLPLYSGQDGSDLPRYSPRDVEGTILPPTSSAPLYARRPSVEAQ